MSTMTALESFDSMAPILTNFDTLQLWRPSRGEQHSKRGDWQKLLCRFCCCLRDRFESQVMPRIENEFGEKIHVSHQLEIRNKFRDEDYAVV